MRSVFPCVKICGLVAVEDAAAVNASGAAYAGFVFWPRSKRAISLDEAVALRAALDERIVSVGVFVDAPVEQIASAFNAGAISVAQLHGDESDASIARLRDGAPGIEVWKAFVVHDERDIARANDSCADLVLLDAGRGSGRTFDWLLLSSLNRSFALAGGLTPENVEGALSSVPKTAPLSVLDVSSGVEASVPDPYGRPRKDVSKIVAFMEAVRGSADARNPLP